MQLNEILSRTAFGNAPTNTLPFIAIPFSPRMGRKIATDGWEDTHQQCWKIEI